MADFFEDGEDTVESDDLNPATPVVEKQEVTQPQLPSKYQGKSIEEIISMHQEAEKLIGRQGNEISEVRKLADQLIQSTFKKEEPKQEEESEIDFFVDPKKAVERVLENHPKLKQADAKLAEYEKFVNRQQLEKTHPDMYEIVESPEFVEWVKKSKIRTMLYAQADRNFDFEAANELLSTFKEVSGRQTQTQTTDATNNVRATANDNLRKATVSAGSSQEVPKKIYRRADLIRLRIENPAKYDAMEDEIMAAYTEGRVR